MMARMPSRALVPTVLATAAVVLAACSSGPGLPVSSGLGSTPSSPARPSAVVLLRYDSFEPAHVTIHAGQAVQWQWQESPIAGNVTFAHFASPTQVSGSWSRQFSVPGTYPFQDTLSTEATGVVTVLP
jgi:plastocyanin